jgi:hypothetical protein
VPEQAGWFLLGMLTGAGLVGLAAGIILGNIANRRP